MGRMTVGVNPSSTVADETWPDEEHVALARNAMDNPFLVIPHPKNADHPLCIECGIYASSTLVVPAPGSIPKWPACKGKFPTTHCRSCATADIKNEYVFEAAICRCKVLRSNRRLNCSECFMAENGSIDCSTEGCGEKRHGDRAYCKSCRNLNEKVPMTCNLCGGAITRDVGNTKGKKSKKGSSTSPIISKSKNGPSEGILHYIILVVNPFTAYTWLQQPARRRWTRGVLFDQRPGECRII
jgi:hypothetical protein